MFIEKRGNTFKAYVNDPYELKLFADEQGNLYDEHKTKNIKEDGLYQAWIGYGTWQAPTIYDIKKLTKLNWEFI